MALDELKLTPSDFTGHTVQELPDRPSEEGIAAGELKRRFDANMMEVLVPRFNQLVTQLQALGAALFSAQAIAGVGGDTLQQQLEDIKIQLDNVTLGNIPDASLTDTKLSQEEGNILERFAVHTHPIAGVDGLPDALTGKAASVHTHTQAQVTGLTAALDGKSNTNHGHTIANVTSLQATLDGKSATSHTHTSLSSLNITGAVGTGTSRVVNVYISGSDSLPGGLPNGTLFVRYV